MTRLRSLALGVTAVICLTSPTDSAAQDGAGVRAGFSGGPGQLVVGGHVDTLLADNLVFRPNVEVGVGDNLTLIGVNFELTLRIPMENRPLTLYLGAGPALNILRFGETLGTSGDTDLGGGVNFLFGLESDRGLFGELKFGTHDSPDLKLLVGFAF